MRGWTSHAWDPEAPEAYVNFKAGDEVVAGMLDLNDPRFEGVPNHWFAYIKVADIAATVAKAETAGGRVIREPFEVPKVGMIAVIADSTGAAVGLLQSIEGGSM